MSGVALAGVDGCPAGWFVALASAGGADIRTRIVPTFAELLAAAPARALIAIDIPIGLPDRGSRPTDVAARAFIGPRRSSVFPAPIRAVVDAATYREASDRSFAVHGKRLSRQTFAILPRIREVDLALRSGRRARDRVHEIHPEVSFCALNGDRPLTHPKRTRPGFEARHAIIAREFPGAFERARADHPRRDAADDDILDAFAALWTARRIRRGEACALPPGAARLDRTGLPMVIWR